MTIAHWGKSQPRSQAIAQSVPRPVPQHDAVEALVDATHWVFNTLRTWRRRARERDQLARLDDRMLQDIGITRAEALHLSDKPFWKD
jgi:uncharacterized protein YjiS (DUF1127 family)